MVEEIGLQKIIKEIQTSIVTFTHGHSIGQQHDAPTGLPAQRHQGQTGAFLS